MERRNVNAPGAPAPQGGYSQAVLLTMPRELVFVSGQIPVAADGSVPADFPSQAAQVWANIDAQLLACGLTRDDIVKVTIFLADRKYRSENRAARQTYLGDRSPAMTVVIAEIFDEAWLLEAEVAAAR